MESLMLQNESDIFHFNSLADMKLDCMDLKDESEPRTFHVWYETIIL